MYKVRLFRAGVAKWQTQQTQNLPPARAWGFKSLLRHQAKTPEKMRCSYAFDGVRGRQGLGVAPKMTLRGGSRFTRGWGSGVVLPVVSAVARMPPAARSASPIHGIVVPTVAAPKDVWATHKSLNQTVYLRWNTLCARELFSKQQMFRESVV